MNTQQLPKDTKAMIFAAGLGTRLKPYTDTHPKALFPVHGKPLLQWNIELLKSYGIRDIIINVHHFAEQIFDFIKLKDEFGINICFSHETDEPLETGGGLKKASWFFKDQNQPFFVINADILSNIDLFKMYCFHIEYHPAATLAVTSRDSSRVLLHNAENKLIGWKNIKSGEERISRRTDQPKQVAFSGIQIIHPVFFNYLSEEKKFSIIDSYLKTAKTETILMYHHDGDIIVDVGKPETVALAEKLFSK